MDKDYFLCHLFYLEHILTFPSNFNSFQQMWLKLPPVARFFLLLVPHIFQTSLALAEWLARGDGETGSPPDLCGEPDKVMVGQETV